MVDESLIHEIRGTRPGSSGGASLARIFNGLCNRVILQTVGG